jgi:sulfonate transport system ATP-binding protein
MATGVHPVSEASAGTANAAGTTEAAGNAAVDALGDAPAGEVAASVRTLTRQFGGRVVLDALNLDIKAGEFVALIGRSGSGKSTLLRTLAGLDRDVSGSVTAAEPVAVAFQEPRLVPWKRVLANVTLGLRGPAPEQAAADVLAEVGLAEQAAAWPLTLSGGEAQRVSLARALVRSPALLLLDEPFSSLDALTRMSMHRLVLHLWERHRPAVLLVTHDVDEALALADRVLVLSSGRIAYSSTVEVPRPRARDHPALAALRRRLLTELGVPAESQDLPAPLPARNLLSGRAVARAISAKNNRKRGRYGPKTEVHGDPCPRPCRARRGCLLLV